MTKIYIQTYGCTYNFSDSEVMGGILEQAGFVLVSDQSEADLIIVNSCTVKHGAETKFFNFLEKCKVPVIVAGCIAQGDKKYVETKLKDVSIIGVDQISKIKDVVEKTLKGEVIHLLKPDKKAERIGLPKVRKNVVVEIVTLNSGCLGSCTYCKTLHARGRLKSYDKESLLRQIRDAVEDGVKEIWLTSQDTGAYGQDMKPKQSLSQLLEDILETPGDFMVRLGMCNPNWVHKYLDELIIAFQHPKMFKFLHIPVQAGSDRVLKAMKREYTVKQYRDIIAKFTKYLPDVTIATDIICGFPGETDKEFEQTYQLIKDTKPSAVNISRFWLRPGTPAEAMEQLHPNVGKERAKRLMELFHKISYDNNTEWIGWEGEVIIDEVGKNNTWIGRNPSYKQVLVKGKHKIGDIVGVKIKSVAVHDLRDF